MKLYFHPASSNARKPRAVAAHLGVEVDLVLVDVLTGEHKKPAHLAINPNGMIPVLDDSGFVLWESTAICQYLADKSPRGKEIWPAEPRERADVSRWLSWELAHFTPATQGIVFENLFKKFAKLGDPDPIALEKSMQGFGRFASVLDAHLSGRDYLVGNKLTLADFAVAAPLTHAVPSKVPVERYKNVQRWLGGMNQVDAWKKTAPPPMG